MPLRIVMAAGGGYALTSAATILLARTLPGSPLDTAMAATMMSFALYTGVVVWVFAAGNARRAAGWLLLLGVLTGGAAWLSLHGGVAA